MPAAIETHDLTKYYGRVVGIESLSLQVQTGEIFGFLGANGAGKTTTMRLLLDLLRPSSGRAAILGFDCQRQSLEARRRVGYLPAEMPMYPDLTGAGYLQFLASVGPAPAASRIDQLCRRFDVSDVDLKRRMRDYSHGMKRKLGLIQALMADPPVVVLDEPTSGLDPLMIEAFAETMHDLASSGRTTVLLSSHVLSEVERICGRIGLVRRGRLVAVQTLAELREITPRRLTIWFRRPVDREIPLPAALVGRQPRSAVLGDRRAWTNRAVPGRAVGSGCGRPRDYAVRARGRDPARVRGASGMKALLWRAAERIRLLFAAVTAILVLFQVTLVAVAASFDIEYFERLGAVTPPFMQRAFGAALASFAGMTALGFFEPLVIMLLVQFAIYAATEPAGDVDSRLVDLIVARPVPRHWLITRSLVVMSRVRDGAAAADGRPGCLARWRCWRLTARRGRKSAPSRSSQSIWPCSRGPLGPPVLPSPRGRAGEGPRSRSSASVRSRCISSRSSARRGLRQAGPRRSRRSTTFTGLRCCPGQRRPSLICPSSSSPAAIAVALAYREFGRRDL